MKESKLCEMINSRVQVEGGLFLKEAVYFRRTGRLKLLFLIKRPVTSALREEVQKTAAELVPDCVRSVEAEIRRAYFDEEILTGFLTDYLKKHAPALSGCLALEKVVPAGEDKKTRLLFRADPAVRPYVEQNRFPFALADLLEQTFCEPFEVEVRYESLLAEGLPQAPEGGYRRPEQLRRIYIRDPRPLVGSPIESPAAEYLIDMEKPRKSVVLCGKVERFSYRLTKTEKHMFRFTLKDFTGSVSCLYFSSEKNLEKMKVFEEEGEHEILAQGELREDERSGLCFWIRDIELCSLPTEFTPAPMPSKPAPDHYAVVFPKKIELSAQENLFEAADSSVSPFLLGRTFVVFDTETTGLYYDLDRIIELGAVRIENGVICEGFHTMIDPERAIPESAAAVNHITDDMVRGQPKIEEVLPDFFKFTRGAALVGHNIEFDIKFLQFAAKKNGYFFENELYDTMELARENVKGLPNLQQKTVAARFGIDVGSAHRALDDALTCARIFLEVMKIKYPPQKASA